jgi:hypothetical protein
LVDYANDGWSKMMMSLSSGINAPFHPAGARKTFESENGARMMSGLFEPTANKNPFDFDDLAAIALGAAQE